MSAPVDEALWRPLHVCLVGHRDVLGYLRWGNKHAQLITLLTCAGMAGHDKPESSVTIDRNTQMTYKVEFSRSADEDW